MLDRYRGTNTIPGGFIDGPSGRMGTRAAGRSPMAVLQARRRMRHSSLMRTASAPGYSQQVRSMASCQGHA